MRPFLALLLFTVCALAACKKDSFITSPDAQLRTSEEKITFDTVFTSVGSVTKFFRIYNSNDQKLRISSVKLAGGASSAFKINADGFKGPEINNLEMEAGDSMYVFVSVRIDPAGGTLPFVVQDSISITYNGKTDWVQLEAWGQNANFLRGRKLTGNVVWDNRLPFVILDGLLIDTTATLTIEKGTKVYLHADAPFIVDGTLKVMGEHFDSTRVQFTGDRLDEPYKSFPGSWPGIYFRGSSRNSELNFVTIANAFQGVVVEKPSINTNPKLVLNGCIIDNVYDVGILGLQTSIEARNCVVSNCGKNIILAYGGNYNFNHCTVAAFSNSYILHKEPVLQVTNFVKEGTGFLTADLTAVFRNSIFWGEGGSVDDEVFVGKQGNTAFDVSFANCLWRVTNVPANTTRTNILSNVDPRFDTVDNQKRLYNFRLQTGSPAINAGMITSVLTDITGKPRTGSPDLGAYEH
ncbi:MAG TPA: choice-of-anchor Q domain-containing protein [Chitinophagaceae bacterium]|nr:choice-of-anchor Q domain-containing protein [Chitinophagaceae bacterium]